MSIISVEKSKSLIRYIGRNGFKVGRCEGANVYPDVGKDI